jgi:hypothetical protein
MTPLAIRAARAKTSALAIALLVCVIPAEAEILLSLHDAQVLVEHTPDFLRAVERGQCPQTSDSILNGFIATVVVRGGCRRFDWIANLYVDVRTGAVSTDGGTSGPIAIETRDLAALRTKFFATRAEERLTPSDAMCLLGKVPPALQIRESCRRVKIIGEEDGMFAGTIEDTCLDVIYQLTVDRYSGAVAGGMVYRSATLGDIQQSLVMVHSPARLTVEDAKRLVEAPSVLAELKDARCSKVEVDPLHNADEVWLQVSTGCGDQAMINRLSVDVQTAAIRVIGPNANLDSPMIRQARQTLLEEATTRKAAAAETLKKECR